MKQADIVRGQRYLAAVNGTPTTVIVNLVRVSLDTHRKVFDVTNTATGRRTTLRTAASFKAAV